MSSMPAPSNAIPVYEASALELFIEDVQFLPYELAKNLNLVRDLDEQFTELNTELEEKSNLFLTICEDITRLQSSDVALLLSDIRRLERECSALCAEKLLIAEQTYQMVDQYVQKLDMDMTGIEEQIDLQHRSSSDEPVRTPSATRKLDHRCEYHRWINLAAAAARAGATNDALETDPDEPRYCYCNGVSSGRMVACDNPDCPYEWFHFECVGLVEEPKGSWTCPTCELVISKGGTK